MFGFRTNPPDPSSVDLTSKRSIQIRSKNEDSFTVDYFYHAGAFWTARIPIRVARVFGQSHNFSKVRTRRGKSGTEIVYDERGQPKPKFSFINHLQTRFQIDADHSIELYPLQTSTADVDAANTDATTDGPHGEPVHRLNDFVYSVEATGTPGIEFNISNGMSGNLLCMHRFLSTQEMVFERVVVLGQFVWESPALPLSSEDKQTVLVKSLERSDRAGLDEVYYLYRCFATNNCTSNPFQIVDECVQYSFWQRLGALAYRLPLNPRLYLRIRGLDSDPGYRKLVKKDFEPFIAKPETQQRKRDVVRKMIQQRRKQNAVRSKAQGEAETKASG